MDGETVTAPRFAIYGLEGDWEVEMDPAQWRLDHHSQLERPSKLLSIF